MGQGAFPRTPDQEKRGNLSCLKTNVTCPSPQWACDKQHRLLALLRRSSRHKRHFQTKETAACARCIEGSPPFMRGHARPVSNLNPPAKVIRLQPMVSPVRLPKTYFFGVDCRCACCSASFANSLISQAQSATSADGVGALSNSMGIPSGVTRASAVINNTSQPRCLCGSA